MVVTRTAENGGYRQRRDQVGSVGIHCFQHPFHLLIASSGNRDLVDQDLFPQRNFPMAAVLACLFDFLVASFCVDDLSGCHQDWLEHLSPVGSGTACHHGSFCMGIGMIVSAASLFFRDVKYIVEVFLTFGIFFTPVFL